VDNLFLPHVERTEQICSVIGLKLVYLPAYSPDLNSIGEPSAELKAFIQQHWQSYEGNPDQGFDNFLEWCVGMVGASGKGEGSFLARRFDD
jgi:hypothetical protein